jgi:hypothetical protein
MLNREITELITDTPNEIFTNVIPATGDFSNRDTTFAIKALSETCNPLNEFFKKPLKNRMLLTLCQAVLDDHREQARTILIANLNLMDALLNETIESKFTFQRFRSVSPLEIAVQRGQIKMIELMIECCEQSLSAEEAKLAKDKILSAWSKAHPAQKNAQGEEEIVIPEEYTSYVLSLINVFARETFPNGVDGELSEDTGSALSFLFNNMLLPESAVKLDDYLDVELFLLALYKGYVAHINTFQNWDQRDAFCIRVIGLVQSVLSPETAKIFCEGLDAVVTALRNGEEIKFSENALKHLFKDGTSFYRSSRGSQEGLGSKFLSGIYARGARAGNARAGDGGWWVRHGAPRWISYVEQKLQTCRTYAAKPRNRSQSCVMF